jgi:FMNH2-dependent dimethyl sulfone monooxygenase
MSALRFGYWLPVFGGWLRNVEDERMEASWRYVRDLAVRSEQIGFDITLIAELNLNDIKGVDAPSLDAWSTAAALAAVTQRLELMVAVRPNFHHPGLLAKEAANIDRISGGRVALNVVSSWWRDEAQQQGLPFDVHEARYARTEEWVSVVRGLWRERRFTYRGAFYQIENAIVEPKPMRPPPIYAGGESEAAKNFIARDADAYVMHGDPAQRLSDKIADMRARRERLAPHAAPLMFGVAGFVICRSTMEEAQRELARITDVRASSAGFANYQQWLSGTQLEQTMSVEEYSVSNRGLRTGLIGTPELIAERLDALQRAGIDHTLLQFSPQAEEMERFAEEVIPRLRHSQRDHAHRASEGNRSVTI